MGAGDKKPLRVVVEVDSITTDAKGNQFAEFKLVQQPTVKSGTADEDEDEVSITAVDAIPEGSMRLRLDTNGARDQFGAGKRFMVSFTEVQRQ
jgi:hypothetical protein